MTLVGSIGRKSLDQAMGPGQHASANEKKRKKHTNTEDWFGAVLQLADRAFVMIIIKKDRYFLVWTTGAALRHTPDPRFAAEDVRYFFPLLFSHLPDRFGCIGSAEVGPASKALVAASFRGTCISHSFGIRGRLSSSLSGPFLGRTHEKYTHPKSELACRYSGVQVWRGNMAMIIACQHVIRRAAGAVDYDKHSCHSSRLISRSWEL